MNFFTWTPLELAANVFTIACIVLAGRNSIHTWWTGLIGCVLYGIMFYNMQLYADTTLQAFFFAAGIIGWHKWKTEGTGTSKELKINYAPTKHIVLSVCIALVVAAGYAWFLHTFTDAYAPLVDSTVLTFSVVAQLLLIRRSIQTWQVWLLVNTLSVPLFWSRELYLTSVLYGAFWLNAVYSYYNWKKLLKVSDAVNRKERLKVAAAGGNQV